MEAIILAGGFAKRMWPLTKNKAKPLLPVGGKPIIEYIIEKLDEIDQIKKIYITTNEKFKDDFKRWSSNLNSRKEIVLVIENHDREQKKMGTIRSIQNLIKTKRISDDVLIIAGDNIFEFDMGNMIYKFQEEQKPIIALHDIQDKWKAANKFGVASIDQDNYLINFEEKPARPLTSLISTGIYLLPRRNLAAFQNYLENDGNPDAPGYFISWLIGREEVKAFTFDENWYDIGSFELYYEANKAFSM